MTEILTNPAPQKAHHLRFWLVLHPVTLLMVAAWAAVAVLGLFDPQARAATTDWPIAAAFVGGVLCWAFWKKLRGKGEDWLATLIGGALMLFVGAVYWLSVFLRLRYGAAGVFGMLGGFIATGLIADWLGRLRYLRTLNRARAAAATGAAP